MTAKQFIAALERLELSQVDASKMLGITDRAIRHYVAGAYAIPAATAKLIRLALAGKLTIKDISDA